jgi:ABC-2 type transport system ATP-binding protein
VSEPAFVLEEVSKWYGEVLAVNEVSAEFGPGVTGLLGPNGAGKSTLMKVMLGMLHPSLGRVRLLGADPFSTPAVMRRVGLVPEQDPVYPSASAFEVVRYLTRLHGFSGSEASSRARKSLERCGLEGAMDRAVAGYSKGMRQRAKIAQAIAHDPDVLVFDEPMNGLDPVGQRDVIGLIRELGAAGKCVIVSSHVLHEVEAMTRRILVMSHGRVVAEGTVSEIRADLSDRPHAVNVRTSAPRDLARRLVALEGVQGVEVAVGSVAVLTVRPNDVFEELARLATEDGIPIHEFGAADENLEAVFRYLTTGRDA